jgi:hypothetical protein
MFRYTVRRHPLNTAQDGVFFNKTPPRGCPESRIQSSPAGRNDEAIPILTVNGERLKRAGLQGKFAEKIVILTKRYNFAVGKNICLTKSLFLSRESGILKSN